MNYNLIRRYTLPLVVLLLAVVGACAPAAQPAQPPVTVTPIFQATATVPLEPLPTGTPVAAQTVAPNPTSVSMLPTPTQVALAEQPNIASGVFATKIRLDPPQPKSGPDYVAFYVTFQNTTSKTLQYKWAVKIYRPDDSLHSFGETAVQTSNISPGTTEIASIANWRTNPISCEPFIARVFWINTDLSADPFEFKKPDGTAGPATNFQVCPASPPS